MSEANSTLTRMFVLSTGQDVLSEYAVRRWVRTWWATDDWVESSSNEYRTHPDEQYV